MNKCSKCGKELAEGAKFCGECGTKVALSMKCPKCGSELTPEMKFCGECGEKIMQESTCPSCGTVCAAGAKFCSHCGSELNASHSPTAVDENDTLSQMERGMVQFRIESLGFHKIKGLKLLQKEFDCTLGDYYEGTRSWMVEPERAKVLKREFEDIGATVEIKTFTKEDIEGIKRIRLEPDYNC